MTIQNPNQVSPKGKAFIQGLEDVRLVAYNDGYNISTIGWGHTKGVKPGQMITLSQAMEFFDEDIRVVEKCLNLKIRVPISQHQYDALASFVFNIGISAFSTSTLLRHLNDGSYTLAAQQLFQWILAGDPLEISDGLINRRIKECKYFRGKM